MTAIVTCGETRQSLSATRALGRAGIRVAVSAYSRPSLSMWSRYASSSFLLEDAGINAQKFAEKLALEIKARYATCAFYSTDEALWAASRFRELLPIQARRILPPHYSVVRSLDHEALHHFATSLKIPCAKLIRVAEHTASDQVLSQVQGLVYPALVRPIIPWIEREDETLKLSQRVVVRSEEHLLGLIDEGKLAFGFLVSAYTRLRAVSYFGVADKGLVLAEGFQERLSEFEPYDEIATLAKTIEPVPTIKKNGRKLLEALAWQGPFKIEFIKDAQGSWRLVSLIGRLWGSLELAIKAGVNIPLICYRLAEGTLTEEMSTSARPNVQMRWLIGDIFSKVKNPKMLLESRFALTNIWHQKSWPWPFSKEKLKSFYNVLDVDDPMPFLFELQHYTWRRAFGEKKSDS